MIILQTNNLCKDYQETRALIDVNMTIKKGEIYGFVGENGAGKSTLIRVITGLANVSSGEYTLGTEITDTIGKLAAVVETPALHLNLSAVNNLKSQCILLGIKDSDKIIKRNLFLVGLDYLINSKKNAKSFSLGMKQRLGIAMALISEPKFLILDEPMNGLDPLGIIQMRELIIKLNQQGITFLVSSHILDELDKIATTFGFISGGKLLKEITATDLHEELSKYLEIDLISEKAIENIDVLKNYEHTLTNNVLRVYNVVNNFDIIKLLVDNGYQFNSAKLIHQTLEEYYLQTIGGQKNV